MERFAANYLYLPKYGFLKQYVVQREEDKIRLFLLEQEIEAVVWLPGIICLLTSLGDKNQLSEKDFYSNKHLSEPLQLELPLMHLVQLNPFDFNAMQPCGNTVYTLL